ncbi:uncharacterized protein LOC133133353 [Conger conger]|uniref:uncharacterized protein LOC133133353 n=1 Tax=Conger conger TaxID=82655 RepID=UPI002A5ADDCC|nr:uncharacterized protein LOC133133353 [Conger conger]
MYHGTSKEAAESIMRNGFNPSIDGMLGRGVYLSRDIQKASRYPLNLANADRRVLELKVNVGRVKKINRQGHPLQKTWHYAGYNTAWVPPNCGMVPSGEEEDCVWNPHRIKVIRIVPPCLENYSEPANNSTYVMYHGTSKEAAESIRCYGFSPSNDGMLGRGVYLSRDIQKASRYPLNVAEGDRRVLVLIVNVGRVKKIDYQGHPLQKTWHAAGYDTAWVPPNCGMVPSGLEEDCVWDPCRINVISVIKPKPQPYPIRRRMYWAEDDMMGPRPPCLENYSEPANNSTYVMYHGTSKEAAESIRCYGFSPSNDGMLGRGVYLSRDIQKASRYPLNVAEGDRRVLVLIVNVGRVKKIDYQGHPLQKTWHAAGYDTAWVPPNCGMVPSGLEEDCVWDPCRINVISVIKPKPQPYPIKPVCNATTGPGVYVSRDIQKASRYPLKVAERGHRVLELKVNVGRVKKIDHQGHPLQKTWHDTGYDMAWVPPKCGMVHSGLEEASVWDPSRIVVIRVIEPEPQPSFGCNAQ